MPHEESRYAGPVAVVEKLAPGEFLVDVVVEYGELAAYPRRMPTPLDGKHRTGAVTS